MHDQFSSGEILTLKHTSLEERSTPSGVEVLHRIWRWLGEAEAPAPPFDSGRAGRWALIAVAMAALAYVVVFALYTFGLQATFRTHAEDLGIMDHGSWIRCSGTRRMACSRARPSVIQSLIPTASAAYTAPPPGATMVSAVFGGTLALTAYKVDPPHVYTDEPELTLTTCWCALAPMKEPLTVVKTLVPPHGSRFVLDDSLAQEWLPAQRWIPGKDVCLQTWPVYLQSGQRCASVLGVEVRVGSPASHPSAATAVPVAGLA